VERKSRLKTLVIDTSVAVKWFSQERDTGCALLVRDAMLTKKVQAQAPDLLLYELANVLRYRPGYVNKDVKLAVQSVHDMEIQFVEPGASLIEHAVKLAFQYDITVYDGCFLALAIITNAPLLSADNRLINKAKGFSRLIHLSQFQP
jgi:predicted nucleic acid-binding protein